MSANFPIVLAGIKRHSQSHLMFERAGALAAHLSLIEDADMLQVKSA